MICASASLKSERMFVLPCPPAPIIAIFTFSLGDTNLGPPSTWRGRMVNAATVVAVAPRNLRRVISGWVAFVFIRVQTHEALILLHCAAGISHSVRGTG